MQPVATLQQQGFEASSEGHPEGFIAEEHTGQPMGNMPPNLTPGMGGMGVLPNTLPNTMQEEVLPSNQVMQGLQELETRQKNLPGEGAPEQAMMIESDIAPPVGMVDPMRETIPPTGPVSNAPCTSDLQGHPQPVLPPPQPTAESGPVPPPPPPADHTPPGGL